jgi:hypothetical protein
VQLILHNPANACRRLNIGYTRVFRLQYMFQIRSSDNNGRYAEHVWNKKSAPCQPKFSGEQIKYDDLGGACGTQGE